MSMITVLKADQHVLEQPKSLSLAVEKLLLAFGGGDFFFQPGETVVFLLDLTLPAENERGVNFDIRLAYALAALARSKGMKDILFAFRPAPGFSGDMVLERSGYQGLLAVEGVRFVDLSQEENLLRTSQTALSQDSLPICRCILQADVILSLVKYRAAEGRLFGSALHSMEAVSPEAKGTEPQQQERTLVDLYDIIPPDLFLVDGLKGKEGFQPQQADFLLAAADAVAADAVLAAVGNIPVQTVESLCLAAQYGLGVGEPGAIALYGDDLAEIMKKEEGKKKKA